MHNKVFVEIGVCDFDTLEPLLSNGWRGYFVEPIEEFANKLPQDKTLEAAISDHDGEMEMYVAKNDNTWRRGSSHAVIQSGEKILEKSPEFVKEKITVKCYTLHRYLMIMGIEYIDLLKLDCEGHEKDILDAYDWSVYPTMIKLEHHHIDDIKMKKFLEDKGYVVYTEKRDMYAIR